jgi:hypothetical protein
MVKDTKDEDRRLAEDILFSYVARGYHRRTSGFGWYSTDEERKKIIATPVTCICS